MIHAAEGASLYSGFTKQITPEEYVERVQNNTIMDVLRRYPVSEGDVFFIPAGRIHAFGLRYKFPNKYSSDETDDSVKCIHEEMSELVAHSTLLHIIHRNKCRRNDKVGNPLERYSDSYSSTTNCVREDLSNKYPADWSPTHHKGSSIKHDLCRG